MENSEEEKPKKGHEVYKSKYFKDSEIKCRLPDGSLYLEEGVRKIKSWEDVAYKNMLLEHELDEVVNEDDLFLLDKLRSQINKVKEEDNDWGDEFDISKIYPEI